MNAPAISRKLRALGFRPVAASDRNRQGLRVTGSGSDVRVSGDLDNEREGVALAAEARQALEEAGYRVEDRGGAPNAFYVVEKAAQVAASDPSNFDRAVRELSYQMGDGTNPSERKYEQYATLLRSLLAIVHPPA